MMPEGNNQIAKGDSMIRINHKGNFKNIEKFLKQKPSKLINDILNKYGQEGVNALSSATPIDSGETARAWSYEIQNTKGHATITWNNSNVVSGVNIAIILQYGHATGNGGYVQGRDYINPAMRPVMDKILENLWKEVTS